MSGSSTSEAARALRGDDRAAIVAVLDELAAGAIECDADTVAACVELLAQRAKAVSRRAAGALARAASSDEHARVLVAALGDADALRRWGAAFALARADRAGPAVLAAAVDALGLDDGDIRWAAAEIVRGAVRAEPTLLRVVAAAADDGPPARRKMALYCLRDLRELLGAGAGGLAAFVSALEDDDRGVRLAALSGVAVLAPESAAADERVAAAVVGRVVACLEGDEDPGLRRAAAVTLGKLKAFSPAAVAALERARDASDDTVLVRAATAALR